VTTASPLFTLNFLTDIKYHVFELKLVFNSGFTERNVYIYIWSRHRPQILLQNFTFNPHLLKWPNNKKKREWKKIHVYLRYSVANQNKIRSGKQQLNSYQRFFTTSHARIKVFRLSHRVRFRYFGWRPVSKPINLSSDHVRIFTEHFFYTNYNHNIVQ
jgi:hypothetical protein